MSAAVAVEDRIVLPIGRNREKDVGRARQATCRVGDRRLPREGDGIDA